MSTKKKPLNPLVDSFFKELKHKKMSVPAFEKDWGIDKERIHGWKKQGTAPKESDAVIIRSFLKGDAPPQKDDTLEITGELGKIFGDIQERLIKVEAQNEVYESLLASLLSPTKKDVPKKLEEIRSMGTAAANRRFDEFRKSNK